MTLTMEQKLQPKNTIIPTGKIALTLPEFDFIISPPEEPKKEGVKELKHHKKEKTNSLF